MYSALVVGGTSGIGKATAELLGKHELISNVATPDRSVLDVRVLAKVRGYVRTKGPWNYIVYSAGVNRLCWIRDEAITATVAATYDVNTAGFITLISEHLRAWPDADMSVVAVSSDAARIPMRSSIAYCASKAALNAVIKVMARELAPRHRINAVAPGMVEGTAMTEYIDWAVPEVRGWTQERAREYERSNTPTGRRATVGEVAESIVWALTGPEQMTGAIIDINGGR